MTRSDPTPGHRARRTPRITIALLLMCVGSALGATIVVDAQDRRERAPTPAPAPAETPPAEAEAEATSEVREVGGEKVKAFEFSGLDIEGQLKSPQMLYFLNRLRAEFGRPRLPHRSFMPELQRSTKGKTF